MPDARVPLISRRDEVAPEHRAAFDAIAESRGRVAGPFSVLLHSPEVAKRAAHLGAYIRFESPLAGAHASRGHCPPRETGDPAPPVGAPRGGAAGRRRHGALARTT